MKANTIYRIGIDVGSTTLKVVILNSADEKKLTSPSA